MLMTTPAMIWSIRNRIVSTARTAPRIAPASMAPIRPAQIPHTDPTMVPTNAAVSS